MLRTTLRSTQAVGETVAWRSFSVFGKKPPPPPAKEAPKPDIPKETQKTSPKPPTTPSMNVDAVKTTTIGNLELPIQAVKNVPANYGLALLHAASKVNQVAAVEKDAKIFVACLTHPKLQALGSLFTDRSITSRERTLQIQRYMKNFSPLTQNLIRANVSTPRGLLIPKMMNEFLKFLKNARKEFTITLTFGPKGITAAERNEAIEMAKQRLGKGDIKVKVEEAVDPKIISGFSITLPDKYVNRAVLDDPDRKTSKVEGGISQLDSAVMRDLGFGKSKYEDFVASVSNKYTDSLLEALDTGDDVHQLATTDSTAAIATLVSSLDAELMAVQKRFEATL